MLNRPVALLLIVVMLSANFSSLFIFAGFELNKSTIASTLCENRDKPWMHCNGKCYLMKKIKQAQEKEKSEERQTAKSLFQEAEYGTAAGVCFGTRLIGIVNTPYPYFELPEQAAAIFQPPKIA